MILSATLKRESIDGETVTYVDTFGGKHSFLAGPVAVRASSLPEEPPALLRVDISWFQAARAIPNSNGKGTATAIPDELHPLQAGERVRVVKNRKAGVRNPAEVVEEHLGKSGAVLWTTLGGANVDLGDETVWFSSDELERIA
jgi:hypothetical protein